MNKTKKSISLGDKIFARVTRNGRTILDFVTERVSNMSELISELRAAMKDIHGLVMIHIRNYHQGWGEDRPLMLYAQRVQGYLVGHQPNQGIETSKTTGRTMFFPWETH